MVAWPFDRAVSPDQQACRSNKQNNATSNRLWSHCDTTADISMIMMMGGNFMKGGEIFTALPNFPVMNGMSVTGLFPQIKQTKQTMQLQIDFGLIVTLQLISA
jgi:hypothetical protein